jgi:hypothetical protein
MKNPTSQAAASATPMLSIAGTEMAGYEVRSVRAAVVYGDKSRRVLHFHHAVTLGDNKEPTDKEVEAGALKFAASELERRRIEVSEKLKVLSIDPDALMAGVEYQVDPSGRKLVPVKPQRPRAAKKARKSRT